MGRNFKKTLFRIGLCVAAILFAGCASTRNQGPLKEVRAALLPGQNIELGGSVFQLRLLPAKLRAVGAGAATTVLIAIPSDTPEAFRSEITRHLTKAGYCKVIFVGPRHVEATVVPVKNTGRK